MSKPDETQVRLLLGLISSVDPGESGHLRGWQALMGRSQSSDLEPEDKQKSPEGEGASWGWRKHHSIHKTRRQ